MGIQLHPGKGSRSGVPRTFPGSDSPFHWRGVQTPFHWERGYIFMGWGSFVPNIYSHSKFTEIMPQFLLFLCVFVTLSGCYNDDFLLWHRIFLCFVLYFMIINLQSASIFLLCVYYQAFNLYFTNLFTHKLNAFLFKVCSSGVQFYLKFKTVH